MERSATIIDRVTTFNPLQDPVDPSTDSCSSITNTAFKLQALIPASPEEKQPQQPPPLLLKSPKRSHGVS